MSAKGELEVGGEERAHLGAEGTWTRAVQERGGSRPLWVISHPGPQAQAQGGRIRLTAQPTSLTPRIVLSPLLHATHTVNTEGRVCN